MLKKIFQPLTVFVLSAMFLALLFGYASATFSWFPTSLLRPPLTAIHDQFFAGPQVLHNLRAKRHDFVGVVEHEPGRVVDSGDVDLTLISSFWKQDRQLLAGFRAIQRGGHVVHEWVVDIVELWPMSPHTDSVAGRFIRSDNYLHGSYLFPNGDIVFNVEFLGLMRMAPDGSVVWRLARRTHHSVSRNSRGNFWVCETQWVEDVPTAVERFFGLIPPIAEDRVLEVSPDGEIVREISILEVVFASRLKQKLWQQGIGGRAGDVVHINDVEELSPAMADEYPLFAAGDLLVSLCRLNLVFVFDPDTRNVKWATDQPHLGQHDPDFVGDGWISVFDNRADSSLDGSFLGGSRLVAVRPQARQRRRIYPKPGIPQQRKFHTDVGGKAQLLSDGNWLLTETTGGRVLEVNARGTVVWEWAAAPVGDAGKMVPEVYEGSRYTFSIEDVLRWGTLGS